MKDEYYRNLESLKNEFGYKKVLSLSDIKKYLNIGDNRTLARRYGIKGPVTIETLAVRLSN